MNEDNITANNIAMQMLDLQHQLFHYAQARQMFLIMSSCELLEERLRFYQRNHQHQIQKILDCMNL